MQAEVDTAIVMTAMKAFFNNKLDKLILIAGDGDFKDMVEFLKEKITKVYTWNYEASRSAELTANSSVGCSFRLDDCWDLISIDPNNKSGKKPAPVEKLSEHTS